MVDHMKRRIVAVRPNVGSALEKIQQATDNDMSKLVHSWAERDESWAKTFASMKKQSEEKE